MASLRDYLVKIKSTFDEKGLKQFEEGMEKAKVKVNQFGANYRERMTGVKVATREAVEETKELGKTGKKAFEDLSGVVKGFIGIQLIRHIKNLTSAWSDKLIMMNRVAKATELSIGRVNALREALRGTAIDMSDVADFTFSVGETMADAANGATTFQEAYDRLGISIEEWGGASPEQRLEEVLVKLRELKSESEAAAQLSASQIFGEDTARKILGNIDKLVAGAEKKLAPLTSIKLALDADKAEQTRKDIERWSDGVAANLQGTIGTTWGMFTDPGSKYKRLLDKAARDTVEVFEQEWQDTPIGEDIARSMYEAGSQAAIAYYDETGKLQSSIEAGQAAIKRESDALSFSLADYGELTAQTNRPDRLIKPWKEAQVELEGMDKIRASKIEDAQTKEQIAYNKRIEEIEAKYNDFVDETADYEEGVRQQLLDRMQGEFDAMFDDALDGLAGLEEKTSEFLVGESSDTAFNRGIKLALADFQEIKDIWDEINNIDQEEEGFNFAQDQLLNYTLAGGSFAYEGSEPQTFIQSLKTDVEEAQTALDGLVGEAGIGGLESAAHDAEEEVGLIGDAVTTLDQAKLDQLIGEAGFAGLESAAHDAKTAVGEVKTALDGLPKSIKIPINLELVVEQFGPEAAFDLGSLLGERWHTTSSRESDATEEDPEDRDPVGDAAVHPDSLPIGAEVIG